MITETNIEQAITSILKSESTLAPFTIENSVYALNPYAYSFLNSYGGAVLVSCSGETFLQGKFNSAMVDRETRIVIALGVRNLKNNEQLWAYKATIMTLLAFSKPLTEMSRMFPVSTQPFTEQADGVFWVRMEFMMRNYLGV